MSFFNKKLSLTSIKRPRESILSLKINVSLVWEVVRSEFVCDFEVFVFWNLQETWSNFRLKSVFFSNLFF